MVEFKPFGGSGIDPDDIPTGPHRYCLGAISAGSEDFTSEATMPLPGTATITEDSNPHDTSGFPTTTVGESFDFEAGHTFEVITRPNVNSGSHIAFEVEFDVDM